MRSDNEKSKISRGSSSSESSRSVILEEAAPQRQQIFGNSGHRGRHHLSGSIASMSSLGTNEFHLSCGGFTATGGDDDSSSWAGLKSVDEERASTESPRRRKEPGSPSKIPFSSINRSWKGSLKPDGGSRRAALAGSTSVSSMMLEQLHETIKQENQIGRPRRELAHTRTDASTVSMLSMYKKPDLERIESNSRFRKLRLVCGRLVEAPWVQLIIVCLIVLNGIAMGIATFDFVTDNPGVEEAFVKLDRTFLSIFTVELILQLTYRGSSYFQDGWLVFDFVIVVASWSLESLQIIRAFRIFRVFRLVTRVGPLRELVMAIGDVMPRIYAIGLLLSLIFYIYGVLVTQLFGDLELSDNYFGSLDVSLFTLAQLMTLEWAEVTREVMTQREWAWIPLVSFVSITGFIAFNLIIAVVCDAVSIVDKQMKAERDALLEGEREEGEVGQITSESRVFELSNQVAKMRAHNIKTQKTIAKLTKALNQQMGQMQELQELYQKEVQRSGAARALPHTVHRGVGEATDEVPMRDKALAISKEAKAEQSMTACGKDRTVSSKMDKGPEEDASRGIPTKQLPLRKGSEEVGKGGASSYKNTNAPVSNESFAEGSKTAETAPRDGLLLDSDKSPTTTNEKESSLNIAFHRSLADKYGAATTRDSAPERNARRNKKPMTRKERAKHTPSLSLDGEAARRRIESYRHSRSLDDLNDAMRKNDEVAPSSGVDRAGLYFY